MTNIPPTTRSSLLIDLEQGKRIEVEALQGAAVRRAAKHGVPVPIVSTLYALLKPWENGPIKRCSIAPRHRSRNSLDDQRERRRARGRIRRA